MNDCHYPGEILSAYRDGELDSPERRATRHHVRGCHECRGTLRAWRNVEAELGPRFGGRVSRVRSARLRATLVGLIAAAAMAAGGSLLVAERTPPLDAATTSSTTEPTREPSADPSNPPSLPPSQPSQTETSPEGPVPETPMPMQAQVSSGPLTLRIDVADAVVNAGEKFRVSVGLTNHTGSPVSFAAPSVSPIDVVLRSKGADIWRRSASWPDDTITRTLRAGERISEHITVTMPRGSFAIVARCECAPPTFTTFEPSGPPQRSVSPFETEPIRLTAD